MEAKENLIEPLLLKAEAYGKTNLELLKLKSVDKVASISASLIYRLLLLLIFLFFFIPLNIALALWLGNLLGNAFYGFLIVAAFYGIVTIVVCLLQKLIKARINNWVITKMLN